jgi:hypothetical protein
VFDYNGKSIPLRRNQKWGSKEREESRIYDTPEKVDALANSVFNYYKMTGYPYVSEDMTDRRKWFDMFMRFDYAGVIDRENKIVRQTMHGQSLCWSYMRHHIGVKCGNTRTTKSAFDDDDFLMKIIRKRIQVGDNMSDAMMRKALRNYLGVQCVSNFRPTAAAAIYSEFASPGSWVWDMSGGYGGRLLGAIRAGVNYLCTEPCTETIQGLRQMGKDFATGRIITSFRHKGSEEKLDWWIPLDLCFTSPPYLDTEKYSNEPTQSYIKFPTEDSWYEDFLGSTIEQCYSLLKPTGTLVLNVSDTMFERVRSVAIKHGFWHQYTWRLLLSGRASKKYEPIIIFKKRN